MVLMCMILDSTPQLENSPLYLMSVVHRLHRNKANELIAPFDITLEMLSALNCIEYHQPIKQQDLANKLVLERSVTKRNVDNLLKRELVEVVKDENNKKNKLLALTPAGSKVRQQVSDKMDQLQQDWVSDLSPEERLQLNQLLKKLLIANLPSNIPK